MLPQVCGNEAMSSRDVLSSRGNSTILMYNALSFLDIFQGCAREAFQGTPEFDTEFEVCSLLKSVVKSRMHMHIVTEPRDS